ncbi:hypothetical protein AMK26_08615 [Streptomyces sp. CB03234]|nr:hypothetical protein AMK26_08615 [Streptomyces sp. CB03234]
MKVRAPFAYAPFAYAPFAYAPFAYAPFAYAPFAYAPFAYAPSSSAECYQAGFAAFSDGSSIHSARYSRNCGPGSRHDATKITRIVVAEVPKRRASAAHTPPIIFPSRGRTSAAMVGSFAR